MALVQFDDLMKHYEFEMTKLALPNAAREDLEKIEEELGLAVRRTVAEEE